LYLNSVGCKSTSLPLLLERAGERRIKSTIYIPLIPTFSLKGEGAGTCVDSYATRERARARVRVRVRAFQMSLYQLRLL